MLIKARGTMWRVDATTPKTLTATNLDNPDTSVKTFFLPLEGSAIQIKQMGLPPSKAGDPILHNLFLRAARMTMIHSTAPLVSLQRSRVIPTNYQLVPVLMALDMPKVRLLIADDVGLGKTIEAGLITLELLARKQIKRILVLTPANLKEQWQEAFDHFFHIQLESLSTPEIKKLGKRLPPGANPWTFFSRIVVSIDYAKQESVKGLILNQPWDLVIVDEAHGVAAPPSTSRSTSYKERYSFVKSLAQLCKHLILATATPHNGYTSSFASLLRMLDESKEKESNNVVRGLNLISGDYDHPIIHREKAKWHVVQRRRSDVQDWFEKENKASPFPKRDSKEIFIEPSQPELRVYQAFQSYQRFVFEGRDIKDIPVLARWMVMHFLRRATSSPEALKKSLRKRIKKLEHKIKNLEDADYVSKTAANDLKQSVFDRGDAGNSIDSENEAQLDDFTFLPIESFKEEIRFLKEVLEAVNKWKIGSDSKFKALKNMLIDQAHLARYPRTIVFSRYVDTVKYLEKELAKLEDLEIFTIDGSLVDKARAERLRNFQYSKRAVLIATDAISEGLNLQFAANQLVHYELPWNPNRLEQRNGRVDRFKQPEKEVVIRTLINERSFDLVVFRKLIEKAQRIRESYGFLPPYFSDERNIESLIDELFSDNLINQKFLQPGLFDQTEEVMDSDQNVLVEKLEKESFYGQANFSLSDVEERLKASQESIGNPEEIERLVIDSFRYLNWQVKSEGEKLYSVKRIGAEPILGLESDLGTITFDVDKAAMNPDVSHLDIAHPIVTSLLNHLRRISYGKFNTARTAVFKRKLLQGTPAHAIFYLRARYRIGQADNQQLIESLIPVAINLMTEQRADEELLKQLTTGDTGLSNFSDENIQMLIDKAHNISNLNKILNTTVEQEAASIKVEREQLSKQLLATYPAESKWLKGISDVEAATHDVIALSIVLPEPN